LAFVCSFSVFCLFVFLVSLAVSGFGSSSGLYSSFSRSFVRVARPPVLLCQRWVGSFCFLLVFSLLCFLPSSIYPPLLL